MWNRGNFKIYMKRYKQGQQNRLNFSVGDKGDYSSFPLIKNNPNLAMNTKDKGLACQ